MRIDISNFEIDKNSPIPLYYQLEQTIKDKILNGEFPRGDCLPTETDFADFFKINRATLRQALNNLVNQGYLYRKKGVGTFITVIKVGENIQKIVSYNQALREQGLIPSTKVLEIKTIKGIKEINQQLELDEDEELIFLSRLRYANNQPVIYLETYMSFQKYEKFLHEDFSNKSLYAEIEEKYNLKIKRVIRTIEALNANEKIAKTLNAKIGDALLSVKTLAYTEGNCPIEFTHSYGRGNLNKIMIEIIN